MDYKVLLVDDHALMRKGLRLLLDQEADLQVVGEAENGETAIQRTEELEPDIVIMDISMPGLNGIEATKQILAAHPDTRVLALSIHGEKEFVDDMLAAGTAGYLLKESAPEELIAAIRKVLGGEIYLSPAIAEVVVSGYRSYLSGGQPADVWKTAEITETLLKTKFYRQPITADLVLRPRLLEQLDRNRHRPLILISAPAGFGKTVLVSQWLKSSEAPSVWLSLDDNDNDLSVFLSYLLTAVSNSFPDLELESLELLAASNPLSVPLLAQTLANDLDQLQEPFILVLDDIHCIQQQEIYALLDILLQHPPSNLHLVLIGRHDPALSIAGLRARGQVTEIRALDLGFTPDETVQLMQNLLKRAPDPDVAAEWTEATEGWVTALRLAALSLRHRGLDDDLALRVQGDSRYLRDYLTAEVLSQLPAHYRNCLIKIAFLDRFCGPLCEALCQTDGTPESQPLTGAAFIKWLETENLFLIPLDNQHRWFRFHHLFQEFLLNLLQEQLSPEDIATLQKRASQWFAKHNLLDEALQYALAAGDVPSAAHLIEQQRYSLMNSERWRYLDRLIELLPADVVMQSPPLLITKAYVYFHFGLTANMVFSFRRAEQLLTSRIPGTKEAETLQDEIDVLKALQSTIVGQQTFSIDRLPLSLKRLPAQALQARSLALAALAERLQMQGDLKRGVGVIRNALAETAWPIGLQARKMHYLSLIFFMEGNLSETLFSARMCVEISEKIHAPMLLSYGRYDLGIAHYLRNEFRQAQLVLQALLEEWAACPPNYLAQSGFLLALIYQAQGRRGDADQVTQILEDRLRKLKSETALALFNAALVELALRQGKLAQAHQLSTGVDFDILPPMWFLYVPQLTSIKLLFADEEPESLAEALARLDALDDEMRRIHRNNVRIDVLALQALVCDAQGDEQTALEKLTAALDLGMVGGNIRSFVDLGPPMADLLGRLQEQGGTETDAYISRILAAFQMEEPDTTAPDLSHLLTKRELQTLRLLATDLSPQDIASEMIVSPATVRTHTRNIYEKLEVHSRSEAVQRAKELGLL